MVKDTLHLFFDPQIYPFCQVLGSGDIMIKQSSRLLQFIFSWQQNKTVQNKNKNLFLKMTKSNFQAICMCRIHNYGSSGALGIDMTVIFSWETDILLLRIPHDKPFTCFTFQLPMSLVCSRLAKQFFLFSFNHFLSRSLQPRMEENPFHLLVLRQDYSQKTTIFLKPILWSRLISSGFEEQQVFKIEM